MGFRGLGFRGLGFRVYRTYIESETPQVFFPKGLRDLKFLGELKVNSWALIGV